MPAPTDSQLKSYYEHMPLVYKRVMQEFLYKDQQPLIYRKGRQLTYSSIEKLLTQADDKIIPGDTDFALDQLVEHGLLNEHEEPILCYSLTELGEQLLKAFYSPKVVDRWIPALPEFSWAS